MTDTDPKQPAQQAPDLPSTWRLVSTLSIVALLSGILVVLVYEYTKPIIAENKRLAIERAIFQIFPDAKSTLAFRIEDGQVVAVDADATTGEIVHAVYDQSGQLLGVTLEAAAVGYQDEVRILYGFDPETQCIIGFKVLKTAETPGLGSKISTDPDFLANFNCLQAQVDAQHGGLRHAIKTVKHGSKQHPWEIDAISGSTITSKAIGRMLTGSGQLLLPVIVDNLQLFRDAYRSGGVDNK